MARENGKPTALDSRYAPLVVILELKKYGRNTVKLSEIHRIFQRFMHITQRRNMVISPNTFKFVEKDGMPHSTLLEDYLYYWSSHAQFKIERYKDSVDISHINEKGIAEFDVCISEERFQAAAHDAIRYVYEVIPALEEWDRTHPNERSRVGQTIPTLVKQG